MDRDERQAPVEQQHLDERPGAARRHRASAAPAVQNRSCARVNAPDARACARVSGARQGTRLAGEDLEVVVEQQRLAAPCAALRSWRATTRPPSERLDRAGAERGPCSVPAGEARRHRVAASWRTQTRALRSTFARETRAASKGSSGSGRRWAALGSNALAHGLAAARRCGGARRAGRRRRAAR